MHAVDINTVFNILLMSLLVASLRSLKMDLAHLCLHLGRHKWSLRLRPSGFLRGSSDLQIHRVHWRCRLVRKDFVTEIDSHAVSNTKL